MSEINLTNQNFESEVIKSNKPVLVDFWAPWCGPCRMIAPIVAEIAENYKDKVTVGKVNIDEQMDLASKYQIFSIPTLLLFKNGEVSNTLVGLRSKEEIEEILFK